MVAAQQNQVVQVRFTSIGPVSDVMRIDVPLVMAPGKAAEPVPGLQRTFQSGGNRTLSSSHINWVVLLVLNQRANGSEPSCQRWIEYPPSCTSA